MTFQLSPGVVIQEKDFTSIAPSVATSTGAYAGAFQWGPVLYPTTIDSETSLIQLFGKPVDANAQSFWTAANFLSYSNNLLVVRADATNARNAVATTTGYVSSVTVGTAGSGYTTAPTVTFAVPSVAGGVRATGTARLSGGGVTSIAVATAGTGVTGAPTVVIAAPDVAGGTQAVATAAISGGGVTTITVTVAGSGYTVPPVVSLTGGVNTTPATLGTVVIGTSSITGITITEAGTGYTTAPAITFSGGGGTLAAATATVTTSGLKINNETDYTTRYVNGAGIVGEFAAKYPGAAGNSLKVSMADSASFAAWGYKTEFDSAPSTSTFTAAAGGSNDELHIVVVDEDGLWTGTQGTILEKFAFVSKANDAKKQDGTNNFYKNVLNRRSQYIWWMDHTTLATSGSAWGSTAVGTTFQSTTVPIEKSLIGGVDDLSPTIGQLQTAWVLFADDTQYDISLLPVGKASSTLATFILDSVVAMRLDCVAFISPENVVSGEVIIGSGSTATDAIIAYRNELPSTSYGVLDSGYKYQYDRYNDVYRWIPLNGDIAGICARTDFQSDPWVSPGGFTKGQVKNVVKLSHSPDKTDRDNLYKSGVNPVVSFPGQGTILYGDKTLFAKPSAFDRINVRRLFIVLEKVISTAAKYQLFEFNDSFTRAQFKNLVEPFLRGVQGKRGITDFAVKCDNTNNTSDVIDRNEFVADIYLKPNRSINFIQLNFIAAGSGIAFSEIGA